MFRVLIALILTSLPLSAQDVSDMAERPGWEVHVTDYDFDTLVTRIDAAVSANGMAVVTRAGPTGAAANRGVEIPDNMVIGVFNNAFAVRILRLSTAAMIHAPIRLYVTENDDGSATLSYIRPSELYSGYVSEADLDLFDAAFELDTIFAAIAQDAITR
ncbi:MAG TPA: DUF302 domain-containing protein [Roseibacterium sp.]|nr:DUF302 domain-containing protein [Roseibacterium sp.]